MIIQNFLIELWANVRLLASTPQGIAILAIIGDVITGFVQAVANECVTSKAMKTGLMRKGSEVLLIIGVTIFELLMNECDAIYIPQGYEKLLEVASVTITCGYITWKELTSVCENLCKANPELAGVPVMRCLAVASTINQSQEEQAVEQALASLDDTLPTPKHMGDGKDV